MNPRPRPAQRPALLRLAVHLAPHDRRSWLADMADEYPHVASGDRARWQLGALGLALRWRLASLRSVPRPQLAIAVMALALLTASPWLLRRYLEQSVPLVTEAPSPSEVGEAAGNAAAFRDEIGEPTTPGETAAAAPEARGERDDAAFAGAESEAADLPSPAAAARQAAVEQEPTAPATPAPLEITIAGNTLEVTVERTTQLAIRSDAGATARVLVDRQVEEGERFLLLLPVELDAADGGAIRVSEFGALGPDGQPASARFLPQSASDDALP